LIDLHCHILPSLDDGVATLDEARQLARTAAAEGVTVIAATPHVRADYPTTVEQMEQGVAEIGADLAEQGIAVEILHGAEIDLTELAGLPTERLQRLTIGQTGRYLLVECPYVGWPLMFPSIVSKLIRDEIVPVIAHPERSLEVQSTPKIIEPLVSAGALIQLTAGSVTGAFGRGPRNTARQMLACGWAHLIASDGHGPSIPRPGLASAAHSLEDEDLARYLTLEVPAAIMAGGELPDRPTRPLRRGSRFRR
jgi:protein-tyrosine phosphatase